MQKKNNTNIPYPASIYLDTLGILYGLILFFCLLADFTSSAILGSYILMQHVHQKLLNMYVSNSKVLPIITYKI